MVPNGVLADARRLRCGLGEVAAAESPSERPRRTVCTDDPGILPGADDLVWRGRGAESDCRIHRALPYRAQPPRVWIMHGSALTLGMRSSKAKCIGANVSAGYRT